MKSPLTHFSCLTDPRVERTREHRLDEMLFIVIASIVYVSGCWNDMKELGDAKQKWLRSFLHLPGGIPSHETINRVFGMINSRRFECLFSEWSVRLKDSDALERGVAIDGKSVQSTKRVLRH